MLYTMKAPAIPKRMYVTYREKRTLSTIDAAMTFGSISNRLKSAMPGIIWLKSRRGYFQTSEKGLKLFVKVTTLYRRVPECGFCCSLSWLPFDAI